MKKYATMKLHSGNCAIGNTKMKLQLPEGCVGFLLVFKTKKAAREFWGKKIELVEVKE